MGKRYNNFINIQNKRRKLTRTNARKRKICSLYTNAIKKQKTFIESANTSGEIDTQTSIPSKKQYFEAYAFDFSEEIEFTETYEDPSKNYETHENISTSNLVPSYII